MERDYWFHPDKETDLFFKYVVIAGLIYTSVFIDEGIFDMIQSRLNKSRTPILEKQTGERNSNLKNLSNRLPL